MSTSIQGPTRAAVAGLAVFAASVAADATPVGFNFADIMSGNSGGTYFEIDGSNEILLADGTETGVEAARFIQDGVSVVFSASGTDRNDFVYLDATPYRDNPGPGRSSGSGVGVCQQGSCGAGDEIRNLMAGQETLTATFAEAVTISNLLFAQENNFPLITEADAALLVEVRVGDNPWADYVANASYTGTSFSFRVQADLMHDLGLAQGNEFYLHAFDVARVAEPATLLLFGLGLAGIAGRRRRA